MNPFLPLEYCIPDAEPHIFGDRVYIYGSMDTPGEKHYCGHQYRVFSARTDDLAHWTDHGAAFSSSGSGRAVPWSSARLFAPDVCEINGTYYLYFCMADKSEGVASSQNPAGPFTNTRRLSYPPGVKDGRPLEEIDPAVFKDDDGHVYYYWGQEKAEAARLKTPYELDAESYVDGIIDARRHFFFEGSSMRKRRGVYYYIYCAVIDGKANHLAYATSCSPLGPFQYRGVIIDNQKCDPESWNIHGSIIEIDGQWYVLYHRSSNRGFFSRRACAEKIYFDQDGFIKTVEMTTQGFIGPINAEEQIPAAAACEVEGGNYITREADGTHTVVNNTNGCRAEYRYIDFGKTLTGRILRIRAAPHISGTMVVSIDSGKIICKISFSGRHSSQWVDLTTQTCEIAGVHSLRISFESENKNNSLCDFLWFTFTAL